MPAGSRIRIKISIKQEIGEEITFSYTAQHKPPENVGSRPGAELLGAIAAAPVAWPGQQPAGQSTDGMRCSRTATGERTPDPTSPSPAEPLAQSASAKDASRSGEVRPRLARLLGGLHVKPSQTFVSGPASHVKPVLKPSAAYTGKVKP